jgi:hypothetical protein
LTIAPGELADTATLTGTPNTANCVPFVTTRVTSGTTGQAEHYQVDCWFDTTTTVKVERDTFPAPSSTVVVEVAVVEFDPARVRVQSGAWEVLSGEVGTQDLTGDPFDLTKTFLVFHSYQNSQHGFWYHHLWRGKFNTSSQLIFERSTSGNGTANGHYYVVEALSGDFTVQPSDIQITGTSNTDTSLDSIDEGATFLTGSWMLNGTTGNKNRDATVDIALTGPTTITAQRDGATGTIDWHGFAVTMLDGTTVQRETFTQSAATTPDDRTIPTPVSPTRSMAIMAGNNASTCGGSFPGVVAADVLDAHVSLVLQDSGAGGGNFDEVRVEHGISGGEADNDISWEVVQWAAGAPPGSVRRMLVR